MDQNTVEPDENNVSLLTSMGFIEENEVRHALRLAKNDLNEAVAYLTGEKPGLADSDFFDASSGPMIGPVNCNTDISSSGRNSEASGSTITNQDGPSPSGTDSGVGRESPPEDPTDSLEFPTTHLYELESRVFTPTWNVPYGRRESLGRCLLVATRLAAEKLAESDDSCRRFLDRCLPTCFEKLLCSTEVNRWTPEVQEGIDDMLEMFVDLVAVRVEYMPVSAGIMQIFAQALDPGTNYQQKNRLKGWSPQKWEKKFGIDKSYGVPSQSGNDPHGYLVDLINRFASKNGFEHISKLFQTELLNAQDMYYLLLPFSLAGDFLNSEVLAQILQPCLKYAVKYVQEINDVDIRNQHASFVSDLLVCVNRLRQGLWLKEPKQETTNELRLAFILRLLKSAHFGSRMQALKEVSKLLDALTETKPDPLIIPATTISGWLTKNKVLSLALEGNIDQAQYCDRLKTLLGFLGPRLTPEEISKIWSLRKGRAAVAVDNVYHIVAQAATKFGEKELDHLMGLIEKGWEAEEERGKERIIRLLGTIGYETQLSFTMEKTAAVLWKLAHHKNLHKELIMEALNNQRDVINRCPKDDMRKQYIFESLKNMKEEILVLPSLSHLEKLIDTVKGRQAGPTNLWTGNFGYSTQSDRKKRILEELVTRHSLMETVLSCLASAKKEAVSRGNLELPRSSTPVELDPSLESVQPQPPPVVPCTLLLMPTIPDGRKRSLEADFGPDLLLSDGNPYGIHVDSFLKFLTFIVKDGGHPLPWARVKELWGIFIEQNHCCTYDRNVCFDWLERSCDEFQDDCKCKLLQEKLLKLDPMRLNAEGFSCFRKYFELVNKQKGKLKQTAFFQRTLEVEQMDLIGMDFVWEVALSCADMDIVSEAVKMLIELSYTMLSAKYKRDSASVHKRFLDECSSRLESTLLTLKGSMVGRVLTDAARVLTAISAPNLSRVPPSGSRFHKKRSIERLLLIVGRYVWTVESDYCSQRFMLAHGVTFYGKLFIMKVLSEVDDEKKEWTLLAQENETLRSIRERIAARLGMTNELDKVEIKFGGIELELAKDQQSLRMLALVPMWRAGRMDDVESMVFLTVKKKFMSNYVANYDPVRRTSEIKPSLSESNLSLKQLQSLEHEKVMPSVMMSTNSQVFDLLYELTTLEESAIVRQVRDLLVLIPSDPAVANLLDDLSRPAGTPKSSSLDRKLKSAGGLTDRREKSPKLKLKGHSPKPSDGGGGNYQTVHQLQEDRMQKLLGLSQLGTSPFRLLYNLEVLSGRLLPTFMDEQSLKNAAQFARDFINANGLSYLVSLLDKEALPQTVDPDCRLQIYERVLQILGYLLCGESELHRIARCEIEEENRAKSGMPRPPPSPEKLFLGAAAAASSSDSQTPFSFADLDLPRSALAAEIPAEEFEKILESLQRIVWAAAGGLLPLLAQCDLKSPHNSGAGAFFIGSPRGGRTSESSTGSSDGSGIADAPTSVHSGLVNGHYTPCPAEEDLVKTGLKLMVDCVFLRPLDVGRFFATPYFADFLLDMILLSCSEKIRQCMEEQMIRLAQGCHVIITSTFGVPAAGGSSGNEKASTLRKILLKGAPAPDAAAPELTGTPGLLLLQVLLKAHLPLWASSSSLRGWNRRVLTQCSEYFSLRSRLLAGLPSRVVENLQPSPEQMLEDETHWILNFNTSTDPRALETDSRLLAGHMQLISTLLKQMAGKKRACGRVLIGPLVNELLFPASRLVREGGAAERSSHHRSRGTEERAKLQTPAARKAAYDLLLELCRGCRENFVDVAELLTTLHHQDRPELAKQWDYMPLVERKVDSGYVGMKNAGATCYMNAVLQQFYLEPGLADEILSTDLFEDNEREEEGRKNRFAGFYAEGCAKNVVVVTSLFYELQRLFSHLKESESQYYTPQQFWEVFRLSGQRVNPREQQDAMEFYTGLINQVDEELKKHNREEIFKRKYQGVFSDQTICFGCPHRYEREQEFYALNLPLRAHGLEESLNQFVKGEILEGDNAYVCEKCGKKRNTLKRMCIKTLPSVLVIQLKRFDYDWEENRSLKFNDHFQFPRSLDMYPYTASALSRNDSLEDLLEISGLGNDSSGVPTPSASFGPQFLGPSSASVTPASSPLASSFPVSRRKGSFLDRVGRFGDSFQGSARYDLSGVVVHSGQASAGHYYAFIRERREETVLSGNFGKWYKFNDTTVEEVDMTDEFMETELFGGKYTAKVEKHSTFPEERERYWNAYLLFYQRSGYGHVSQIKTPKSTGPSRRTVSMNYSSAPIDIKSPQPSRRRDSLGELSALVEQGEKQQLFRELGTIPSQIKEEIKEENLEFARNRDIFNVEYFNFVAHLVGNVAASAAIEGVESGRVSGWDLELTKFSIFYLLNLCWHTKKSLRMDADFWVSRLAQILERSPQSCRWFFEFLASSVGQKYLESFLFDCDSSDIRQGFGNLIACALSSVAPGRLREADSLVGALLRLIQKEAVDQWQKSAAYFQLIQNYAALGAEACGHLLEKSAFTLLLNFMVEMPAEEEWKSAKISKISPRAAASSTILMSHRWTLTQAREFGAIYNTLAMLILNCDVGRFWTCGTSARMTGATRMGFLACPREMEEVVFGRMTQAFIKELIFALNNVYNTQVHLIALVKHCMYSNAEFSKSFLVEILNQLSRHPSNELRRIFGVLEEVLRIEDPLQEGRMEFLVEGTGGDGPDRCDGILNIIKSAHKADSRRSYNCVKFLVKTADACPVLKDVLNQRLDRWQWCVDWLREKMGEVPSTSTRFTGSATTQFTSQMQSNEESSTKMFQRTVSAQYTLESAAALLSEFEKGGTTAGQHLHVGEGDTIQRMEEGQLSPGELGGGGEHHFVEIECSSSEDGSNQGPSCSKETPKVAGNSKFYLDTP